MPKPMTKGQFRRRWESNDEGGGITHDDIARCATAWGLYSTPRVHPMSDVRYAVLKAAGVNDAEEFAPQEED